MKAALVTGASSGIGEALALELARSGYRILALARRRALLDRLVAMIRAEGGQAEAHVLDVSDGDETARVVRALDERCGGLDLIVACAGVGAEPDRRPYEWEAVRAALQTNFVGAAATLTAVLPRMVERKRGHLVGISSLASYGALPGGVAYCAPKAGLSMILDCLRLDTHGSGVTVTEVKLGFVATAAVENARHPLPQLQQPEEVAQVLVKRLNGRPDLIVYPRVLGWAARLGAALPEWSRRAAFRWSRADGQP